jgi:hypothetical protein
MPDIASPRMLGTKGPRLMATESRNPEPHRALPVCTPSQPSYDTSLDHGFSPSTSQHGPNGNMILSKFSGKLYCIQYLKWPLSPPADEGALERKLPLESFPAALEAPGAETWPAENSTTYFRSHWYGRCDLFSGSP